MVINDLEFFFIYLVPILMIILNNMNYFDVEYNIGLKVFGLKLVSVSMYILC